MTMRLYLEEDAMRHALDRGTALPLLAAALQRAGACVELGRVKTHQRLEECERQYHCRLEERDTAVRSIDPLERVEWAGEAEMLRRLEGQRAWLRAMRRGGERRISTSLTRLSASAQA